jgi:hypothetical protein
VVELADTYGLSPYAEERESSSLSECTININEREKIWNKNKNYDVSIVICPETKEENYVKNVT